MKSHNRSEKVAITHMGQTEIHDVPLGVIYFISDEP